MESTQDTESSPKIGYIVIVNRGEEGYVGGYLSANERGVPIEFWHTADSPVKADRIQQLLYGKTLMPELLGKHIAGSLLGDEEGKAKAKPHVLFTQEEAILDGFDIPGIAVVLIKPADSDASINDECTCRCIVAGTSEVIIRWRQENTTEIEQLIPEGTGGRAKPTG